MDSSRQEEIDLLHRLRAAPELFEQLHATAGSELSRQQRLREAFPEDLVRAALTLDDLRKRAGPRFSHAARMWFDRTGLEQATTETVARHKAQRFAGRGRVWDLCSGIGSDAIALAARGEAVAVDLNPAQCLRTAWNAELHGVAATLSTVCADVETLSLVGEWVHIDPDRRPGGRARSIRLEEGAPALPFLQELAATGRGGAIKVSPASNFTGKFPGSEIELVSLDGECKEATIWYGELGEPDLWRATVLRTPGGSTSEHTVPVAHTLSGMPLDWVADLGPLDRYLFDPDPAIVRAGLVDRLAVDAGFVRLDSAEEYLTAGSPIDSPFARGFEVLAELPWREKDLRAWLREHPHGTLEIKCRHVAVAADELRRRLPREGTDPLAIIIARIGGRTRAVMCRRLATGAQATPQ